MTNSTISFALYIFTGFINITAWIFLIVGVFHLSWAMIATGVITAICGLMTGYVAHYFANLAPTVRITSIR